MTEDLVKRARELASAATEGPWKWTFAGKDERDEPGFILFNRTFDDPAHTWILDGCSDGNDHMVAGRDADRAFIAASRELVPELCDALEQARSGVAALSMNVNALTSKATSAELSRDEWKQGHDALCVKISTLFPAIEHGDAEHRAWLKAKMEEHFGASIDHCLLKLRDVEIERDEWKAKAETLAGFARLLSSTQCTDGSCCFKRPEEKGGQHTNGGCQCIHRSYHMRFLEIRKWAEEALTTCGLEPKKEGT